MKTIMLRGVLPVLPTVFHKDGEIDKEGVRAVLEYVLDAGVDGVVFPGLASEYDYLTRKERAELVALVGEWVAGRVPFIVGASAQNQDEILEYASQGAKAGACAAMILSPHSLGDDRQAIAAFFNRVGSSAGLSIMMQNAPRPMGTALDMDAICDIARDVDAIAFVKEETPPCGQRISAILGECGESLKGVFGGAGGRYVIDELNRGASGTLPACEVAEIHVKMYRAHAAGNRVLARDLFDRALPLLNMQAVFRWRLTKEVLFRRGLINHPFTRARGPELDAADLKEVEEMLSRISDLAPTVAKQKMDAATG